MMRGRIDAFKHAFSGIRWVFSEHPNLRIHTLASIIAIIGAFLFKFNITEFSVLVLTILLVLTAEMINTAIEEVTDLITVKWAKQAKIAKDVSAGMVLVAAIGSIIIGILLFIPKII